MDNLYNSVSSMDIAKKWGVILGVVSIIMSLLSYILVDPASGMSGAGMGINCLSYIAFIVILYLAINEHKKLQNGYLTIGEGFKSGFLSTVVGGIIATAFQIIYLSFINPGYLGSMKEQALQNVDDTGSGQEAEMVSWIMDIFTNPVLLGFFSFFIFLIGGAIVSIIIAAILNNKPRIV